MAVDVTSAATTLVELMAMVEPEGRAAVLVFDLKRYNEPVLYSNAAAADLIPAMRALLVRLEAGVLRLPVAGGVRWVAEDGV